MSDADSSDDANAPADGATGSHAPSPRRVVILASVTVGPASSEWRPRSAVGSTSNLGEIERNAAVTEGTPVHLESGADAIRFDKVTDAVAAANRARRSIEGDPGDTPSHRQARCWAIHASDAHPVAALDGVGATVRRAAAISAAGHDGQILASDAAWSLLLAEGDTEIPAVDLGLHRLADLLRPERIWQVGHETRNRFPPLRSLDGSRHRLPSETTPLIGRETELVDVGNLISQERLVTLTGAGGVGKTRLASAAAAAAAAQNDLIAWADLTVHSDAASVSSVVLEATGIGHDSTRPPIDVLVDEFEHRRGLLVLDNCEHVLDEVARFVGELLPRAHGVAVLATSREALGVTGEVAWRVPSLSSPTPETHRALRASAADAYPAVRLFTDRAARVRPGFALDDDNAPVIGRLCHYLDGIPLAIELAAAHCRQMPVEHIAADLAERTRLVASSARTNVPRHETIRACVDWSYERLERRQQQLFRRLGVFAGPFPASAADHVRGVNSTPRTAVIDELYRLVDANLLAEAHTSTGPEFRMLTVLRSDAWDRAVDLDDVDALRDAHATWWSDWLAPRASALTVENLAAVDEHYEDLLAATRWLVGKPVPALELLTGLAKVSQDIGRAPDLVALAERVLTPDVAANHPAEWLAAASATSLRFDLAGTHDDLRDFVVRVRQVAELHDDEYHLAIADFQLGDRREECTSLARLAAERGDRWVAALASTIAAQFDAESDPAAGLRSLDRTDDPDIASGLLAFLRERIRGRIARDLGRFDQALAHAERLAGGRSGLVVDNAVRLMSQIGLLTGDRSLVERSVALAERSLHGAAAASTIGHLHHVIGLIDGVESSRVDPVLDGDQPVGVGTAWLLCREAVDAGAPANAMSRVARYEDAGPFPAAVRAAIEAAATEDVDRWHEALQLATEFGYPLLAVDALEHLAAAALRSDSAVEAARLLGAAEHARDGLRYHWRFHRENVAVETVRRATLDSADRDLVDAFTEGSALSIEDASEYARRARGRRGRPRHGWDALTPTELSVVELVADGLTNPEIGRRLLMGRATVKTHLEHVFNKVGVRNRSHVAAEYTRRQAEASTTGTAGTM